MNAQVKQAPAEVEAIDLGKTFSGAAGDIGVLDGISFAAGQGEFWAIMGPSGAGKTTLLKVLGDLLTPTRGSVRIHGLSARAAREKHYFSFVFQRPVLLPWRRVRANVQLPLEVLGLETDVDKVLALMGLEELGAAYPHQLSGGQQQRVAIARALTFEPRVLLMDEPFGALDELTREAMNLELLRVWDRIRVNVFLITHARSEAVFLADKVLVLSSRPARVKALLDIPFPRPRCGKLRESPEFQHIVQCLRELLN